MDGLVGDVVGGVCLVVGVVVGLGALWIAQARRVARGQATSPTRYLYTATSPSRYGDRPAIGVFGTIVSAPALRAPLTERPCVVWGLCLLREDYGAEYPEWNQVWADERVQDLEIAYDLRKEWDESRPRPYLSGPVPDPGTVKIDADRIELKLITPPGGMRSNEAIEVGSDTLPVLDDLGAPQEMLDDIESRAHRYRLVEATLAQGAFVRCAQEDPDANFMLFAGSTEDQVAWAGSVGVRLFVGASLFMLLLGWVLMVGE